MQDFESLKVRYTPSILLNSGTIIRKHQNYQFGFRQNYSVFYRMHSIADILYKRVLEGNKSIPGCWQAFFKMRHVGLIHKLNSMLPKQHVDILT